MAASILSTTKVVCNVAAPSRCLYHYRAARFSFASPAFRPSSPQSSHATAFRPAAAVLSAPTAADNRAANAPPATLSDQDKPYAVIDVGGSQQFVEEGTWFACRTGELQSAVPGAQVQFDKVIAVRSDGEFLRGKPYLANVVVEGTLVEEFAVPGAHGDAHVPVLGKVLVTRIRHSEDNMRLLQEAFCA